MIITKRTTVRTVGELRAALAVFPDEMPVAGVSKVQSPKSKASALEVRRMTDEEDVRDEVIELGPEVS